MLLLYGTVMSEKGFYCFNRGKSFAEKKFEIGRAGTSFKDSCSR